MAARGVGDGGQDDGAVRRGVRRRRRPGWRGGPLRVLAPVLAGVVLAACVPDFADPPAVAPGIVASTPAPGGQSVPRGAPIVVRFDRAMNQGTVTIATNPVVALGAKQWLSDRAVWVAPTAALPAATSFQVTVTGTASDGTALAGGTGFAFTTAAGTAALPTAHPRILLAPGGATAPRTVLAGRLTAGDAAAVRFKEVIDDHLFNGATLISEYRPWWGALLGVLTGNAAYCTDSVARVDAYVAAAEAVERLIREGPDAARQFVASFNG